MPYTARTVTPGGQLPDEYRKRHGLSKAAHWAYDQRTEGKKRTPARPALKQEDVPSVRSVPRGMQGYGEGHGAMLRAERRNREREKAYNLAGARMAELERTQTGETRRREMMEAGSTMRRGMQETGLGTRAIAGRLGKTQAAGALAASRMAELGRKETGLTKRRQMQETGIARGQDLRLTEARAKREEKTARDAYGPIMRRAFDPYFTEEGELPPDIDAIRLEADEIEALSPGQGAIFAKKRLKEYKEESQRFTEFWNNLLPEEQEDYRSKYLENDRLGDYKGF